MKRMMTKILKYPTLLFKQNSASNYGTSIQFRSAICERGVDECIIVRNMIDALSGISSLVNTTREINDGYLFIKLRMYHNDLCRMYLIVLYQQNILANDNPHYILDIIQMHDIATHFSF